MAVEVVDLVAQAGVSTVVAGTVAYFTTLWKTNGEIRRLRAERDELHYSHRQANYHNLLNAERMMHAILREGQRPPADTGWEEVKDRFRECVNGVIISGSAETVAMARRLDHAYFGARSQFGANLTPETVSWNERNEARRAYIEAVRADLGAPGSRRV